MPHHFYIKHACPPMLSIARGSMGSTYDCIHAGVTDTCAVQRTSCQGNRQAFPWIAPYATALLYVFGGEKGEGGWSPTRHGEAGLEVCRCGRSVSSTIPLPVHSSIHSSLRAQNPYAPAERALQHRRDGLHCRRPRLLLICPQESIDLIHWRTCRQAGEPNHSEGRRSRMQPQACLHTRTRASSSPTITTIITVAIPPWGSRSAGPPTRSSPGPA